MTNGKELTWAKIKAAALSGEHPLVNEAERKIKCPRCEEWFLENKFDVLGISHRYFAYLVPVRRCPNCRYLFAVVI
jgi:hypothetical protein